jgi:dienelactone hydrolase
VVINHGIPVRIDNIRQETPGFARAAQWFEARGYMVVVALRPGFGSSDGPYLEDGGDCRTENYVDLADRTGDIESAIVRSAAALPGADAQRIVVVGQSAGGLGAIALADVPPPGVVGVINFAGGRGGDDQEHICGGADRLAGTAATLGQENQLPQLWLYAANDHFFAPPVAHAMVAGYQARSPVPVRFVDLPAFADDGHNTFAQADPAIWAPPVTAFLQDLGLPAS